MEIPFTSSLNLGRLEPLILLAILVVLVPILHKKG